MQDPGLGKDKHSVQNRKSRKDKGLRTEGLAVQRERERSHGQSPGNRGERYNYASRVLVSESLQPMLGR